MGDPLLFLFGFLYFFTCLYCLWPFLILNFASFNPPSSLWKSCYYHLLVLFCSVCFLDDIFFSFGFHIMLWLAGLSNGDVFVVG